ncbi:threonine-phosphate decarboxylase [Rhizobium sp. Root274]|uniref:threonine-phosphate decarboxylase CobD n=1 Tax=unclassified Rhizobium TaxID=2613769 RepID=UPI0007151A30|nr:MULTISPECIES: threonine-phosphate decarboxylase CobD [unclassified Rhizobium]KQW28634.1 threonine-phosphate decarboxylase [Rhizobium sp. Root1240]KRD28835.1 threonine-phosphate decarboxylase [Rhizobium sp. Root274]
MSAPIQHGGGLAAAAELYGGRIEDWLDLSTGINPCPPPLPEISPRAWHRLPDQEREQAARDAARHYYRSGHRLPLPVPGTQSVIQLLPRLVRPGARVAILSPTYGEYARAFQQAGLAVDQIADLDAITRNHGLVVVVNPNNPDARAFSPERLTLLAEEVGRNGGLLVIDEAFGDVLPQLSMAGSAHPSVIIFRSFGKFFGLAGIRLGFVIADERITSQFAEWLGPWAVSGPALEIAADLLSSNVEPIRGKIAERCHALHAVLRDAGLEIRGEAGLLTLVEDQRAGDLHTHLCRHHILTRKFDYRGDWLRFGLSPDQDGDRRLAEALKVWRNR